MHHRSQELAGKRLASPAGEIGTHTLHLAMSAKPKVTKTKTALKQETYNLSDLKHALHCGFVELGGSVSVSGSS
jgi:hypothetical protein